ncbi:hypothetical protein [Pseudonocardia sp. NPDC046786]|uniref:hypothetical protein n=1 Tax=Pseudonocardia sp. NPDC046786 TaxID=3155471 RepID=UPI0033E4E70C
MASETTHDTETSPVANDTDPRGAETVGGTDTPVGSGTARTDTAAGSDSGADSGAVSESVSGSGAGAAAGSDSGSGAAAGSDSGSGSASGSGEPAHGAATGAAAGAAAGTGTASAGAAAGAGAVVGAGLGLASLTGTSLTDMLRSREELVGQIEAATGMPGDSIDAFYGAPWNVAAGVNGLIALVAVVLTTVLLLGPAKRPGTAAWVRPVALGGLVLGVLGLFVSGGMYLDLFASQPVLPEMPMMPGMPG